MPSQGYKAGSIYVDLVVEGTNATKTLDEYMRKAEIESLLNAIISTSEYATFSAIKEIKYKYENSKIKDIKYIK